MRKLKDAVSYRAELVWAYHEFKGSLKPDSVLVWLAAVEAWEADNTNTNPFVFTLKSTLISCINTTLTNGRPYTAITQHGVRLALAEEEVHDVTAGEALIIHDDISPGMLISSGIDLKTQL